MKTILFLFTKKFPYGIQETYLFDELPYLSSSFKEVIIVPHDEFEYNENENRLLQKYHNIRIFKINQSHGGLTFLQYLYRELLIHRIFFYEMLWGRDRFNHLKRIFQLTGQLRHLFSSAFSLKEFIKERNYPHSKIIFYNYWLHRGVIISEMLNRISGVLRAKVISRAHSFDLYHNDWLKYFNLPSNLFLPFERWKLKCVDAIFPISEHGKKHLLEKFPFLKQKIKISRLGVKSFSPRTQIGTPNELLFVTCSWGTSNKRLHLVLDIMEKMKVKVNWVHFGGAEDEQMKKINERIGKYKINPDSIKINPKTSREEVLRFYAATRVDLFLNLSLAEGIPVALMEAASFSIPMVATNTVGNPEIVNDDNGFLIDVNFDPREIAKKLDDFFADPDIVERKRQASFRTFETLYNADKNYPEFVNDIKSI